MKGKRKKGRGREADQWQGGGIGALKNGSEESDQ